MKPPTGYPLRSPTPPATSSPLPPSPSPALPLPSALVPPKKRRVLQTPRKAATPIPPPPPLPALASPAAGAGLDALAVPAPTLPPLADVAAAPPSTKEPLSPPVEIPSLPRPPPATDDKPSPLPPTDAAGKPATTRKVRNYRRKVVPKGTIVTPEAAAGEASAAAGGLHPGAECAAKQSPGDQNAVLDEVVDKGQNLVETAAEKPVAVAACEALLGKKRTSGGTFAGKPEDCDAAGAGKLVSKGEEGKRSEVGMSDWKRGMIREVFVGGLDRDATEDDVRAALDKAGEITEVRMVMDAKAKKNKGFCFVSYREAAQARKAIEEFGNVKICRSFCRVAALETNGKIFLGNIDRKWKKEDIMKLLQKTGVENINTVTLKADYNKPGYNRGYAHLELETNRDARMAFKKLSKKGVFGKWLNITVEWATPLNCPDEKEMQEVKSVFVEGVPNSWGRGKMIGIFKKYGKVEHVVLSCDMHSAVSTDIAYIHYTTREAAILCVESFDGQELIENDSKVNIKVSLAKPFRKGMQNKDHRLNSITSKSFEAAPYRIQDNPTTYSREKQVFSVLGDDSSYRASQNPCARYGSTYATATSTSSYGVFPHSVAGHSPPYHHGSSRLLPGFNYGVTEPWCGSLMRQPGYRQLG